MAKKKLPAGYYDPADYVMVHKTYLRRLRQEETPAEIRARAERIAAEVIDAIPGALGMTPDPWPDGPSGQDGQPHKDVADIIVRVLSLGR